MKQTSGEKPNGPASECLQEQTGVQGGKRILLQGDKLEKSNNILATSCTFDEIFWQEHGQKAVQSYRKAGKLKFGEER